MRNISCGITGGTGVLGRKIIEKLPFKFIKFTGDLANTDEIKKWVNENHFDIFLHLGAVVATKDVSNHYIYAKKVNILGTYKLFNFLSKKKNKPEWVFFASSSHVYGERKYQIKISENYKNKPSSQYGKTKLAAERKIINLKNKINICTGRIFSFTSNDQKIPFIIPVLKKKIFSRKKLIYLENLNHHRDFISLNDIIKAIYILFKKKKIGIYNIGSSYPTNLLDFANYLAKKNKKIIKSKKNSPTFLISNNSKLRKLGIKVKKLSFRDIAYAK